MTVVFVYGGGSKGVINFPWIFRQCGVKSLQKKFAGVFVTASDDFLFCFVSVFCLFVCLLVFLVLFGKKNGLCYTRSGDEGLVPA